MVRWFLVAVLLVSGVSGGAGTFAQTKKKQPVPSASRLIYTPRDRTIEIFGGAGLPMTHPSFTRYWLRGPSAGMSLLFRASEHIKLGFGAEATLFSFRRGNFFAQNPGVPVQAKDMVFVNVYLLMRRYFQPTLRTSPYVGAELGFLRISGAEYKEIVNGVRVTYYDIPGALRLTASAVLGVDQYLSRRLAIQVDVRATYIHNDPSVGLILGGRGGLKLTL
jgi:hypothetical protein